MLYNVIDFVHGKMIGIEKMRCDICNSEMLPALQNVSVDILVCPECTLYKLDGVDIDLNSSGNLDENNRVVALGNTRKNEFDIVCELMKKYIQIDKKGLDVGCSYGDFLSVANDNNYNCVGIEPEKEIAAQARILGHRVIDGFFPIDVKERYDFIVFNNSYEHISDTNHLLRSCAECLSPNGVLIITIPLSDGIIFRFSKSLCRFGRTKNMRRLFQLDFQSPHVYFFNKKNFKSLFQNHNFELIDYRLLNEIDLKTMNERMMMDKTEKFPKFKATIFRLAYPIIKMFHEDKGVFVFKKIT